MAKFATENLITAEYLHTVMVTWFYSKTDQPAGVLKLRVNSLLWVLTFFLEYIKNIPT